MDREHPNQQFVGDGGLPPSAAWQFAMNLLRQPAPGEFLGEADTRKQKNSLGLLPSLSRRNDCQVIGPERVAEASRTMQFVRQITGSSYLLEAEWDPTKHPRRGSSPNAGWFAPTGNSAKSAGKQASDPSRWYLPAAEKGKWLGKKGESKFRLSTPVNLNGKMVREIQYKNGLPILDGFKLPGQTATVVLTGESKTDIQNAKKAWQELNPGKKLPPHSTFHHDLLHVVEETVTIDGKKTRVLIGKMHLVPTEINQIVFHEGSASVAAKFYGGLQIDVGSVRRLAREQSTLAGNAGSLVAKASKKIVPGKMRQGHPPLLRSKRSARSSYHWYRAGDTRICRQCRSSWRGRCRGTRNPGSW